jgi:predicted TPR repeat methyltransferase
VGKAPAVTERLGPGFFDDLYARDPDPWGFETSTYEAQKYDATIAALDGRTFASALEIGCSIGVLTAQLAPHCERLLAVDVAEAALAQARERVPGVTFTRREIPEDFPEGPFDLIVASEVLYYLDVPAFEATLDAIRRTLAPGGALLAVHWRPLAERYPLRGDEVHERLCSGLGWPIGPSQRTEQYNLDRFDRPA